MMIKLGVCPLLFNTAQEWKELGVTYAQAQDYLSAETAFGKACTLEPKLLDACYYWARTLYALNRFEASLDALNKTAAKDSRTLTAKAQCHEALGHHEEAEQTFLAAIALKDREASLRYGIFLFRSGRLEEAARALVAAPPNAEAAAELGRVRYQQGRLDDAERELRLALERDPSRESARLLLEKVRRRQGVK